MSSRAFRAPDYRAEVVRILNLVRDDDERFLSSRLREREDIVNRRVFLHRNKRADTLMVHPAGERIELRFLDLDDGYLSRDALRRDDGYRALAIPSPDKQLVDGAPTLDKLHDRVASIDYGGLFVLHSVGGVRLRDRVSGIFVLRVGFWSVVISLRLISGFVSRFPVLTIPGTASVVFAVVCIHNCNYQSPMAYYASICVRI